MTKKQRTATRAKVDFLLGMFMTDCFDRNEVVESIIDDVCEDIDTCADWSNFEEDEFCDGDIDIALSRVLKNRLCVD